MTATTEKTLLSVDTMRWWRWCKDAGHPQWDSRGCWCGKRRTP